MDLQFYTGSYNDHAPGGIAQISLDPLRGTGKVLRLTTDCPNPSFLAFHPRRNVLYAANELPDCARVTAYRIAENGSLTLLDTAEASGGGLCHIALSPRGNALYGANYGAGNLLAFALNEDGSFGPLLSNLWHQGHSSHPRQDGPRVHQAVLSPLDGRLIGVDFGANALFSYRLGPSGEIQGDSCVKSPLPPGEGPRHLVFDRRKRLSFGMPASSRHGILSGDPSADDGTLGTFSCGKSASDREPSLEGRLAYIITELGNRIYPADYDPETGAFSLKTPVSLVQDHRDPSITAGEIALSPDGKRLYASVRGADKIVVFQVPLQAGSPESRENPGLGTLRRIGEFPSGGREPRMFSFDPTGKWLLIANQGSNRVSVLPLNPETGLLATSKEKGIAKIPVSCVSFAAAKNSEA